MTSLPIIEYDLKEKKIIIEWSMAHLEHLLNKLNLLESAFYMRKYASCIFVPSSSKDRREKTCAIDTILYASKIKSFPLEDKRYSIISWGTYPKAK